MTVPGPEPGFFYGVAIAVILCGLLYAGLAWWLWC
jgi:hypothetical protein